MSFGSSVTGRIVGASSAAIAVPIGLLVTLGVVAAITGGGGFGGLDQLTSGPELPGVEASAPAPASPLDGGLPALPAAIPRSPAARRAAAAATIAAGSRGEGRRPASRRRRPAGAAPGGKVPTTARPPVATTTTPTATTPPAAATTPATPARPATRPNPLREIVRTVQGVVTTVPAVGPPVADAVGTVADLILPPLPGSRATQGP